MTLVEQLELLLKGMDQGEAEKLERAMAVLCSICRYPSCCGGCPARLSVHVYASLDDDDED